MSDSTAIRRIAVGAVLALAAGFTCSHLWGEPAANNPNKDFRASGSKPAPGKTDQTLTEDLAHSKFAEFRRDRTPWGPGQKYSDIDQYLNARHEPLNAQNYREFAHGKGEATIGISKVPDARLDRLTGMYNPKKRVPATIEFSDIAMPVQADDNQRRLCLRHECLQRRGGVPIVAQMRLDLKT